MAVGAAGAEVGSDEDGGWARLAARPYGVLGNNKRGWGKGLITEAGTGLSARRAVRPPPLTTCSGFPTMLVQAQDQVMLAVK